MAPLFSDFDIDMDEVEAPGGFDFEDGHYGFVIAEALIQNGTKNDPDDTKFIIKYDLNDGEAGTYWEWFTVAVAGDPEHSKAKQSLGFLKNRLLDLGFVSAELNGIEPEDLEGIEGTLELRTTNGKGKNANSRYQNVRNVKVGDSVADDPADETVAEEPVAESDAEIKKRVAANREARAAETTAVPRGRRSTARGSAASSASEDNPFA